MGLLENFQTKVAEAMNKSADWWDELQTFTGKADAEAEMRFPGQARDSSQKNAFRHALGAGRLAQLMGANSGIPIVEGAARGAAKLAGYGWEGLGGTSNWGGEDMRHDLNANALGIAHATQAPDFRTLADSLQSFAQSGRRESPPNVLDPAKPYFTYTK